MPARKRCGCHAVTGAVALVLLVALSACARQEPVRIASHVWVGYEPMFLARSLGWLDEALVTLQETASARESMAALTAGQVDGAALTLDEVLQLREQGVDLTAVMVFNVSVGADVILARPPIASLADLAGRRVAFEHGAVGELMVVEALRQAGLTRADVEAVDLSADALVAAYADGAVDVVVTYEPYASLVGAAGAAKIFDSSEIPEYIVDVLAVRNDRLGSGRVAALEHLIDSHLQALDYFLRNPQDATYRMADRLGLPPAEVLSAYRGLVLPDLAGNYRLLQGGEAALLKAARRLVTFKVEQGLLSEENDLDRLLSARYLPPLDR